MRPVDAISAARVLAGAPLFACGISYWAFALAGVVGLRGATLQTVQFAELASAACFLALCLAFAFVRACRKSVAMLACAMLALASAAFQVQLLRSAPPVEGAVAVDLRLEGDALPAAGGSYAYAEATFCDGARWKVRVSIPDSTRLLAGSRLRANARFEQVAFQDDDTLWYRGVAYTGTVESYDQVQDAGIAKHVGEIRGRVVEALELLGDDDGIVAAVVCGWRAQLYRSDAYDAFRKSGTAHLVAVSGAHLAIVAVAVTALARALGLARPVATAVLAALLAGYFTLAGAPVSCLRALIMAIVSSLSYLGVRRPHALNALGASMLCILVGDLWSSVSVSFALSCLATAGILVLAQPVHAVIVRCAPMLPEMASGPLAVTTAASIAVQPLSCALFGVLPVIAPAANLCASALFQPLCLTGLAGGLLAAAIPALAGPFLAVARLCAVALAASAGCLAALPQAWLPVDLSFAGAAAASAVLVLATFAVLESAHPARIVATCSIVTVVAFCGRAAYLQGQDAVVMFDVGQGDSFLVRSGGVSLVVDTGNDPDKLERALRRFAVSRCDFVFVTHKDADHCGCLSVLDEQAPIGTLLLADGLQRSADSGCRKLVQESEAIAEDVVFLKPGDCIAFGHAKITVLWPSSLAEEGGNADSLSFVVEFDVDDDGGVDTSALFVGDCEHEQTARMAQAFGLGSVDILKVGHHGSADSLDQELVEAIHPRIALIGVGARNRYGHPTRVTLDLLDSVGCKVYRSDLDGDVSCKLGPVSIEVARGG